MTDDDDPTPPRLPRALPRPKTQDDRRYTEGVAARKAREEAAPLYICGEATGVLSGAALKTERGKRPTEERIEHVEERLDDFTKDIGKKVEGLASIVAHPVSGVGAIAGRLDGQDRVLASIEKNLDRVLDDQGHRVRTSRDRWTKVIGGAVALLTSGAVLHWLVGRL